MSVRTRRAVPRDATPESEWPALEGYAAELRRLNPADSMASAIRAAVAAADGGPPLSSDDVFLVAVLDEGGGPVARDVRGILAACLN